MEGTGNGHRIRWLLLAPAAAILLAAPAGAWADTGQLTFGDCLTSDTTTTACTPIPGAKAGMLHTPFGSVYGLAASPDGNNVYAVSGIGSAVVAASRSPADGALAFLGCITSNSSVDGCLEIPGAASAGTNTGLGGMRGVALSPDGRSLYTASESNHAVGMFSRDPATGVLTYQGCFTSDTDVTGCTAVAGSSAGGTNTPLQSTRFLAVSPDGAQVYVAADDGDAVARFNRDSVTGTLTYQSCLTSNTSVGGCTAIPGAVAGGVDTPLESLYGITVSPDGANVYTAAYNGHTIARFARAPNGVLTFTDCLTSQTAVATCTPVPGATATGNDSNLFGATSVEISADGRNAYVASESAASVTGFDRDPSTGALTQRECFTSDTDQTACADLPGAASNGTDTTMQYPERASVSADGLNVYVASYSDTALRFDRNPATGALTYRDCLNSDGGIGGCTAIPGTTANGANSPFQSASSLAVPADGRNVYVGAEGAEAVSRLNRELPPPVALPSNEFAFGKLKRNKRKGTAKLTVELPGPGSLTLGGKGVKPEAREATAAGAVKLLVKAKGKRGKRLRKRGKVKVKAEVSFTPTGGEPNTQTKPVKLIRRR